MSDLYRRSFERWRRVDLHMDAAVEDFPEGSKGAALAAQLKEGMAKMPDLEVLKAASLNRREQGTVARGETRRTLTSQVKMVSRTGETIALEHVGMKGLFALTLTDKSDQTLIAVARSMADSAATFVEFFAQYNIPASFIQEMRLNADRLERSAVMQDEGVRAGVNTNASIKKSSKLLDDIVERLDVVVRNKYLNDPAKLATWESAYRREAAPRSRRNGGNNIDAGSDAPPPTQ